MGGRLSGRRRLPEKQWWTKTREQAYQLTLGGDTGVQAAAALGMPQTTVSSWVRHQYWQDRLAFDRAARPVPPDDLLDPAQRAALASLLKGVGASPHNALCFLRLRGLLPGIPARRL